MKSLKKLLTLFLYLAMLAGVAACTGISVDQRIATADALAKQHRWQMETIPASPFILAAYLPQQVTRAEQLTIYIEGDGLAWVSQSQPSLDPTPIKPVALELALRHPDGAAAYLARPCQYVRSGDYCRNTYWTNRRFAPEVIASTNQAIDYLKKQFGARELVLVGYSGGGAVAALAAAQRHDVTRLVTVAGNLDHAAWTSFHHATPLNYSLNPADAWQALQNIPQLHLVGERDDNITVELVRSYLKRFPDQSNITMKLVRSYDHSCCWADNWGDLFTNSGR